MTDNNHPITPPPELVQQWCKQRACINEPGPIHLWLATEAARWGADQQLKLDAERINKAWQKGADQELEACCADVHTVYGKGQADWLRSMRRPKPPSLKEQALILLDDCSDRIDAAHENIIRRALEALPNGRSPNP